MARPDALSGRSLAMAGEASAMYLIGKR